MTKNANQSEDTYKDRKLAKLKKGKMDLMNKLRKVWVTYANNPRKESEQTFFKLMHRSAVCFVANILRAKCKEFIRPDTLYFVSPVVHRHFNDDKELMGMVRKMRNYNRHKKVFVNRVKKELMKTNLSNDVTLRLLSNL